MPLIRDLTTQFVKLAAVVIALTLVYPYVVTSVAGYLNGGHAGQ